MFIFNLFRVAVCSGMQFLQIFNFESTKVARCLFRRTETKEERKRTRTRKRYTSNSLKLVEEVTPRILFLDTKLLFLRMSYFKWMHISKTLFSSVFLCSGMKLEFLLLTGIK